MQQQLGVHLIMDAQSQPGTLLTVVGVKKCFDEVCKRFKFHVLNRYCHEFEPQGLTCVYTLSESHLSIHTWPEHDRCCIDLFHCSDNLEMEQLVHMLTEGLFLETGQNRVQVFKRGF